MEAKKNKTREALEEVLKSVDGSKETITVIFGDNDSGEFVYAARGKMPIFAAQLHHLMEAAMGDEPKPGELGFTQAAVSALAAIDIKTGGKVTQMMNTFKEIQQRDELKGTDKYKNFNNV